MMNKLAGLVAGALLGMVVGALGSAFIYSALGSPLDDPDAGHMTRGAGAFAIIMLGSSLGILLGVIGGYLLGEWQESRDEQRARDAIPRDSFALQRYQNVQRASRRVLITCVVSGALVGFVIDLFADRATNRWNSWIPWAIVGAFVALPVMRIVEGKSTRPRLVGTIAGLLLGAGVGANYFGFFAALAGAFCGGGLGFKLASLWNRRQRNNDVVA